MARICPIVTTPVPPIPVISALQGVSRAGSAGSGSVLTPWPPQQTGITQPPSAPAGGGGDAATPVEAQASGAECWRYAPGGWSQLPTPLSLSACVQALYAGRCERRNEAAYGRWGAETLRLTDGRVEVAENNRDFHNLIDPWPGCASVSG